MFSSSAGFATTEANATCLGTQTSARIIAWSIQAMSKLDLIGSQTRSVSPSPERVARR